MEYRLEWSDKCSLRWNVASIIAVRHANNWKRIYNVLNAQNFIQRMETLKHANKHA